MSVPIEDTLTKIIVAEKGNDVRDAIHDGIATCYADVMHGVTLAEQAAQNANNAVSNVIVDFQNFVGLRVELWATNGVTLSDMVPSTTISALVWNGSQNIADSIDASRFVWHRVSKDLPGDIIWDSEHAGVKSVTVTTSDIALQAQFRCDIHTID
jgi:hypothetical protein